MFNNAYRLKRKMNGGELIPYQLETLDLLMYRDPCIIPTMVPGKKNGPKYEIGINSREIPSEKIEHMTFTYPRAEDPAMDQFLRAFVEAMVFWETVNVYTLNPTKTFDKLVSDFLEKNTGKKYREFRREAQAYKMHANDYGKVARKGLRGKLFDYRSKLYLSALAAVTAKGADLEKLLNMVQDAIILPIKKEKKEPTFEYIYKVLHNAHSE
ncbi:MAG: hypothetical protein AABX86_03165 [Nanoarchaeota archaeon]